MIATSPPVGSFLVDSDDAAALIADAESTGTSVLVESATPAGSTGEADGTAIVLAAIGSGRTATRQRALAARRTRTRHGR